MACALASTVTFALSFTFGIGIGKGIGTGMGMSVGIGLETGPLQIEGKFLYRSLQKSGGLPLDV